MNGGSTMLTMGRKRSKPRDLTDPRGQLGAYVEWWIDRNHGGDKERLAKAVDVTLRTVHTWCAGTSAPDLCKLDRIAKAIGHNDWMALAAAVLRHTAKRK